MPPNHERIAIFVFGVVFIITMLVLAVLVPEPKPFPYLVFKTVLSLAAAGVTAMLPGSLELNVPGWIKAGSALAVFVLVMYKSPAALVAKPPEPVIGSAILRDGFRYFDQSGFQFASTAIVAWNSATADVLAARQPGQSTTGLFIPYDAQAYKHPEWDHNAVGGIQSVPGTTLTSVKKCPVDGYRHHWFMPQKGGLYCVRARDGKHFAVIRVDTIDDDRIGFEFMFMPHASAMFVAAALPDVAAY